MSAENLWLLRHVCMDFFANWLMPLFVVLILSYDSFLICCIIVSRLMPAYINALFKKK
jgi:hypothetical protein